VPALAAGCSLVLKPSEITPISAFRLAELAIEAGVPEGVFNVVNGRGGVTGEALVTHPDIAKVSFTGSTAAGKHVAKRALDRLARVSLELGGKNPAIVLKDADMAKTVGGLLEGAFANTGQICAAISRIYVEKAAYVGLREALADAIQGMSFGSGLDPATQITPLTSAEHRDRVMGHLATAASSGVELIKGGTVPDTGYFVSPTLILNAEAGNALQRNEVFGPVVSLTCVENVEEAVQLANDTSYGLSASLWTENLSAAMDVIPKIQAGIIWVNDHLPLDPTMPFGGFKQSGIGRDFGPDSLLAYTESKSVCIAY
jgi:phenylacetaldehyde dehydrogenase